MKFKEDIQVKNYTYGWALSDKGYVEVPEDEYNNNQKNMAEYIKVLSGAISKANCGWDGVVYKLMKINSYAEPFMVLCVGGHGERWIPIDGNSKGCIFAVLGENLW
jgi:hypothetical protein